MEPPPTFPTPARRNRPRGSDRQRMGNSGDACRRGSAVAPGRTPAPRCVRATSLGSVAIPARRRATEKPWVERTGIRAIASLADTVRCLLARLGCAPPFARPQHGTWRLKTAVATPRAARSTPPAPSRPRAGGPTRWPCARMPPASVGATKAPRPPRGRFPPTRRLRHAAWRDGLARCRRRLRRARANSPRRQRSAPGSAARRRRTKG